MSLLERDKNAALDREYVLAHAAQPPTRLKSSLWGAAGFTVASLLVFGSWDLAGKWMYARFGELGAYGIWAALFMLSTPALLSPLLVAPRRLGRFYGLFSLGFLLYAVGWTATWFLFRNRFGECLASIVGPALLGLVFCGAFRSWDKAVKIGAALIIGHALGYFTGGFCYEYFHGSLGKWLWGLAYGIGFGFGIGCALYECQEKKRPKFES